MKKNSILFISLILLLATALLVTSYQLSSSIKKQHVYAEYYFTPTFNTEIDYSIDSIKMVEAQSIQLIKECAGTKTPDETTFLDCIKTQTDEFNKNPDTFWYYGQKCIKSDVSFSDKKAVFCVNTTKVFTKTKKGWNNLPVHFKFALDFSEEARKTAEGNIPDKCFIAKNSIDLGYCHDSSLCTYDLVSDKYVLVEDCRGNDGISGTTDDCLCPQNHVCGNDGKCVFNSDKCTDGTPVSACSANKGFYCDTTKNLIEDCDICACQAGYKCESKKCVKEAECAVTVCPTGMTCPTTMPSMMCVSSLTTTDWGYQIAHSGEICVDGTIEMDSGCCLSDEYFDTNDNKCKKKNQKYKIYIDAEDDQSYAIAEKLQSQITGSELTRPSLSDPVLDANDINNQKMPFVILIEKNSDDLVEYNHKGFGLAYYINKKLGFNIKESSGGKINSIDAPSVKISYDMLDDFLISRIADGSNEFVKYYDYPIIIVDPAHGFYEKEDGKYYYQRPFCKYLSNLDRIEQSSVEFQYRKNLDSSWIVEDELTIDISSSLVDSLKNKNLQVFTTRNIDKVKLLPYKINGEGVSRYKAGAYIHLHSGIVDYTINSDSDIPVDPDRSNDINARHKFANLFRETYPDNKMLFLSIHTNAGNNPDASGILAMYSYNQNNKDTGHGNSDEDMELCSKLIGPITEYAEKQGMKTRADAVQSDLEWSTFRYAWQTYTEMPACTLELGFHDSKIDYPLLSDPTFLDGLGKSIEDGLTPCAYSDSCPYIVS